MCLLNVVYITNLLVEDLEIWRWNHQSEVCTPEHVARLLAETYNREYSGAFCMINEQYVAQSSDSC